MRVPRKNIAALVKFVAAAEKAKLGLVDIAVVSKRQIAAVNRQYLGHRGPTDVISFDLSDAATPGLSCQIIVCGELAVAQAAARDIGVQAELMLYIVHGLLHVMGCDDTNPRAAARMHARQEQLLEDFFCKPSS